MNPPLSSFKKHDYKHEQEHYSNNSYWCPQRGCNNSPANRSNSCKLQPKHNKEHHSQNEPHTNAPPYINPTAIQPNNRASRLIRIDRKSTRLNSSHVKI